MSGDKSHIPINNHTTSTVTSTEDDIRNRKTDPPPKFKSMTSFIVNSENKTRPRKRFSYPLLSSYEKELPGIRRLPLSPVKPAKQRKLHAISRSPSPSPVFRLSSCSVTTKICINGNDDTKVKLRQNTYRPAAGSLLDYTAPDIYDPVSVDTFSASCFKIQRNRILRRLEKKENDSFSVLPDEMVLKIFSFLPKSTLSNCTIVNQRFYDLATDETLWKRIDCNGRFLSPESSTFIFSRNPVYLRLSRSLVTYPSGLSEHFLAQQLLYLDLTMAEISPDVLARILSFCTSLQKLSLEALCVPKEAIEGMMTFSSTIVSLNLTMCCDLNFEAFHKFLGNCLSLKSLNLGCVQQEWTRDELLLIIKALPTGLEKLNLAGFVYRMMDEHVQMLVSRLHRLKVLDLSDSQQITQKSLQHIVNELPRLELLGLSRCYAIPPIEFNHLSTAPKLKSVQIFAIFKETIMEEIRKALPKINFNQEPCSTVARPTVGVRRSSIWGQRVRD